MENVWYWNGHMAVSTRRVENVLPCEMNRALCVFPVNGFMFWMSQFSNIKTTVHCWKVPSFSFTFCFFSAVFGGQVQIGQTAKPLWTNSFIFWFYPPLPHLKFPVWHFFILEITTVKYLWNNRSSTHTVWKKRSVFIFLCNIHKCICVHSGSTDSKLYF